MSPERFETLSVLPGSKVGLLHLGSQFEAHSSMRDCTTHVRDLSYCLWGCQDINTEFAR